MIRLHMFQERSLFHILLMTFLATVPFQSMILHLMLEPFVSSVKHVFIHGTILEGAYIWLEIAENMSPDWISITFQMARILILHLLPTILTLYMTDDKTVRTLEVVKLFSVGAPRTIGDLDPQLSAIRGSH